jgi:hypothetical protein
MQGRVRCAVSQHALPPWQEWVYTAATSARRVIVDANASYPLHFVRPC